MDLVDRGIYTPIAIGMKGGAWREASMVVLAEALSAGGVKEIATESKSSLAYLKLIRRSTASIRRSVKRAFQIRQATPATKEKERPSKLVTVCAATTSASAEQPSDSAVDCPSSSV